MITITPQDILKRIISLTIVFTILFSQQGSIYAQQSLDLDQLPDYIKVITSDIDKTIEGKNQEDNRSYVALQKLCLSLSHNDFNLGKVELKNYLSDNQLGNILRYDAEQSLFVTIVCNSLLSKEEKKNDENKAFGLNSIIKTPTIRSLGLACKNSQHSLAVSSLDCSDWSRANTTDYSYIFYNLIKLILNDILNLTIARSYGVINATETDSNLVNAYIVNTFNTLGFKPEAKLYPKTYNILQSYIKSGKNIQRSTTIVNAVQFATLPEKFCQWRLFLGYSSYSKCSQDLINTLPNYQGVSIDLLYNEFFFYILFDQIYNNYLSYFRQQENDLPQGLKKSNVSEAIALQNQRSVHQETLISQSLTQTIRQINNTIAFYPTHIGMLMYQEDLISLRNNLAKIYLPLHQLHYKLENVQKSS